MPAPHNPFKSRLAAGEALMGAWVGLADSYAAEITASAGFDWLLIDGEHAPNDLRSIMAQLRVVQASGSHPVVRLPMDETWAIKQVLDIGAQSILIPMVESRSQAERLVRATRYAPQGNRGVGAALARASGFAAVTDYIATAGEQIWLGVQVETRAGLAALDDILAVEGVDGVFIGPADLAADMGFGADLGAAPVVEAVLDAIRRIAASGKAPGILMTDPALAQQCLDAGARFVATSIDVITYALAIRAAGEAARALRDG
ncbi:HpcH/HpaI aldolase/citrate lyase family protein [Paracoccus sp. Z118]|uniref:HpcH/HpaI aldolase family protein n=1 Tax=Paracoccus sp. Z118 TaxID=2851017 RepID=UPI001C2C2B34|nr:HpcH/HpaI aldolase/citrate lyase family protein [Paracoccus sp. Z118]MBV0892197.1 HpcH/HpaI aldolase/citrate lyase family protein [Paracoccus sp. Z118]